ncbi:hypothetical protein [Shewanella litoralis]|uniref:Terminase small subunit n=1 Tax=Shewanella litoralis TaxID=2282700 RepID=A0ABQ2RCI2_9GAMM|nr:hypothetical protein [Shewanella litoralis]GGQ19067.1 hypothetical protein GCM10009411_19130 [Shewanella litoralis]
MATLQGLAHDYAKRIKDAIKSDGFINKSKIDPKDFINSKTQQEIKAVKRDIDGITYQLTNKAITEDDKRIIIDEINRELGLPRTVQKNFQLNESASNDDLSDLADVIENMLGGKK